MKIAVRCDSSTLMGTGHQIRCLTLADEFRRRGADVHFWTRPHKGSIWQSVFERGYPIHLLTKPEEEQVANQYHTWVGRSAAEDAEECKASWSTWQPNWILVDHYGLSNEWEESVKEVCPGICSIDDLQRDHSAELVVDPTLPFSSSSPTKPGQVILQGPRYAMLREEYRFYHCQERDSSGPQKVFVYFGGSDLQDLTCSTVKAFCEDDLKSVRLVVGTGPNFLHRRRLEELAEKRPATTILDSRDHLADVMATSTLAIGAAGGTTWERACLGLPTIAVSLAENQQKILRSLEEKGILMACREQGEDRAGRLAEMYRELKSDPKKLQAMSEKGRELVDGMGVARIVEKLLPSTSEQTHFRSHACEKQGVFKMGMYREELPLSTITLDVSDGSMGKIYPGTSEGEVKDASPRLLRRCFEELSHISSLSGSDRFFSGYLSYSEPEEAELDGLRISILSDAGSWINASLSVWVDSLLSRGAAVSWVHDPKTLTGGEICFFLSCGQYVGSSIRSQFRICLVVHESNLPQGKGWSPLTWQVLEGVSEIPVTLFEAANSIDSGEIFGQEVIPLKGTELLDELHDLQAESTFSLCNEFIRNYPKSLERGVPQKGGESVYRRRRPVDSGLDPSRTLEELFPALRVASNQDYPAFFRYRGCRYRIETYSMGRDSEREIED
jgi:UDP-2,4-diacetamido-2,4,6-trideoxy-beta-L-altropyranose hydrolase